MHALAVGLLPGVPFDDPLAGRTAVALAELAHRDWIRCAMEPLVDGVLVLDRACGALGFTPHTVLRTEHTSTAVRMAAAGVGVVMAPAHMVRGAVGEDCVLLSLDPSPPRLRPGDPQGTGPWRSSPGSR